MNQLLSLSSGLLGLVALASISFAAPSVAEPLWPNGAPDARGTAPQDIPTLTRYAPADGKGNGATMLVLPGGSYAMLAGHEGQGYAEWFAAHGVTAYVLHYRLGSAGYRHPVMLHDAARALRTVRARARAEGLDPARVGIIGSSAGGHLASTLLTHFDAGQPDATDLIERESSRPDIGILCYPVVTMGEFTHGGSKYNLLGENPSADLVHLLSNETQVTRDTPPCFLWHTVEDNAVPVENSLQFAAALRRAKVPFELHLYEKGGHGLGLPSPGSRTPAWDAACLAWLKGRHFLAAAPDHHGFAPTPPMGWNSWDYFGTTLDESHARAQADAMAEFLKPAGYDIFTVDIQWYEPNSQGHGYREGAPLEMDAYGRLVPAVKKFPSAANGAGFKPLADYVHAKGLRFGIHLMRGIPRQAVRENTPVLGTSVRVADIANPQSTCAWNPDMFGVDLRKPGAQAYYDSLFELYASWGVDFVKVDDIARPYDDGQKAEIEAIRRAIDKTGRRIVLSLSPGDTPIERGAHVMNHANLWRISDDFWDRWEPLHGMFGRLEKWTKYRADGAWPDADMLPFGIVEHGRPTRFTRDEQTLCMTLWCIARSPLIFGGDLTRLDAFTRELLTNPEVLAVNQRSANNRQLSRHGDLIVWVADVPGSRDRYVALFNAQSAPGKTRVVVSFADLGIEGEATVRDLWQRADLGAFRNEFGIELPGHAAAIFRLSPQ